MAKLYVPACGDRITLTKSWQFPLYLESRNLVFATTIGLYQGQERWAVYQPGGGRHLATLKCELPEDTVLECDRVYIRTTAKSAQSIEDNYDSISWKVVINDKPAKNQRFWVKLSDCYSLEFDPNSISTYQERK